MKKGKPENENQKYKTKEPCPKIHPQNTSKTNTKKGNPKVDAINTPKRKTWEKLDSQKDNPKQRSKETINNSLKNDTKTKISPIKVSQINLNRAKVPSL